ncbi:hypothetical protein KKG31_03640, partial [Patescibacteria group bacterium]|nr:hypothetical protein [Patescibacteria group bacterium]
MDFLNSTDKIKEEKIRLVLFIRSFTSNFNDILQSYEKDIKNMTPEQDKVILEKRLKKAEENNDKKIIRYTKRQMKDMEIETTNEDNTYEVMPQDSKEAAIYIEKKYLDLWDFSDEVIRKIFLEELEKTINKKEDKKAYNNYKRLFDDLDGEIARNDELLDIRSFENPEFITLIQTTASKVKESLLQDETLNEQARQQKLSYLKGRLKSLRMLQFKETIVEINNVMDDKNKDSEKTLAQRETDTQYSLKERQKILGENNKKEEEEKTAIPKMENIKATPLPQEMEEIISMKTRPVDKIPAKEINTGKETTEEE